MSDQQLPHLLPNKPLPLNQRDENQPVVFNFPNISNISQEKFDSSYKEDPSKTSSYSNSSILNGFYPQIPDSSIQEAHTFKKGPLTDRTNNNPRNIPNKNAKNQIPFKSLSQENINPQSHLSSISFYQNAKGFQLAEIKEKESNIRIKNDPSLSLTSIEQDTSLSSLLKDQSEDGPILAKGSPGKYIDKDMIFPDSCSDIPEEEVNESNNAAQEVDDDVKDLKDTQAKLEEMVDKSKDLNQEWLDLSFKVRMKAIAGRVREAYDKWMEGKEKWQDKSEEFNPNFYRVNYCTTFIQYLGFMFKQALPKLKEMEEFYDKQGNTQDLGDRDIGYLYNEIGKCESEAGHKQLAEGYLAMAKERIEKCKVLFILIHCLSTHGEHYLKYKDYKKAQGYFERALELTKGMGEEEKAGQPAKDLLLAWGYIDLADVLICQEDFVGGATIIELATEKLKAEKLLDSFFMAKVKRNQARLPGNVENSVRLYEDALEILKKTLPEGNQLEEKYEKEFEKIREKGTEVAEGAGQP